MNGSRQKAVTSCLRGRRRYLSGHCGKLRLRAGCRTVFDTKVDEDQADDILEAFYKFNDRDSGYTPAEAQNRLTQELLNLCGSIPVPEGGSITFVSKLPFGFAYPEHPSTHLFEYPDLGCAVCQWFRGRTTQGAGHWRRCPGRSRYDPRSRNTVGPSTCWNPGAHLSGFIRIAMRTCGKFRRWWSIFHSTSSSSRLIVVTAPAFGGPMNLRTRKHCPVLLLSTSLLVFSERTIQTY